ncbi:hypothetical protein ABAC402_09875 [Asticcacaulis sp. AC402]|nr:hypothetical protein ABAC402_09875 [Asticcacaulis sp. AC402]
MVSAVHNVLSFAAVAGFVVVMCHLMSLAA